MNIFIIPSWYPSQSQPLSGIFIKEQAEALAEFFPEHNFIISNCEIFYHSITKPGKLLMTFKNYSYFKAREEKLKANLFEYKSSAATYSEKLGGEIDNVIKTHIENFLKAESKAGKIDIIHAHVSYTGGFSAMKLKEKFKIPYVITEHMGPFPFPQYINDGKLSHKISDPMNNADKVIAVSNFSADQINSFGIKRPLIIPNLVNEKVFLPAANENRNDYKVKFLTVSALTEAKGITELLEAIDLSLKKNLNAEFTIAGSGPLENYVRGFISKNNLREKVKLISGSSRDAVVKLFSECDAFILPSRLESFGIVGIEAMACGKPVIATACGGPADYIKDFNGLLTGVNNPQQIADAAKLITEKLNDYSPEKIRNYVLNNYSGKIVAEKIISVYKEILEK